MMVWAFTLMISVNLSAQHSEIYVTGNAAINGYDPVAYFTENKAVRGKPEFTQEWKGVSWLFGSKENAEKFKASPEKYAPQYGGYCAYGCSRGYKAKTAGDAWSIVDGKLYLNYNKEVRETWKKDPAGYIRKADSIWSEIKTEKFQ